MGLMVANRGLPEIEALRAGQGTELALTLLRSVGWLSRADMSIRRGHAGPGLPTPEAQCIGEYTFEYALIPHGGAWMDAFDQAQAFNAPLRAVSTLAHAGALPSKSSFVEVRSGEPDRDGAQGGRGRQWADRAFLEHGRNSLRGDGQVLANAGKRFSLHAWRACFGFAGVR